MGDLINNVRKSYRLVKARDLSGVTNRVYGSLQRRMIPGGHGLPVRPWEIADSASTDSRKPPNPVPPDRPLSIGWVTTPPGLGSGGHTTLLRMVAAAEAAGHRCVLYLYDRFDGELAEREAIVRRGWPELAADVADATRGITGVDVVVASSWQTAHALATYTRGPQRRMYFIQDYEPYFYARGTEYSLAEDTYKFGYHNIALGHMVAHCLKTEIDVTADTIAEFGCDTDVYSRSNDGPRNGVVFYSKPGVPRRGYALAELALEEFSRRHPEQEIHLYGDRAPALKFAATHHSRLAPHELAALYNRSITGLGMSFTNISLVVEEMLACGLIPVVNDSPMARADMPSRHVAWVRATPSAIVDELSLVVEHADGIPRSRAAAASVRSDRWQTAQQAVLAAIETMAYGKERRHR